MLFVLPLGLRRVDRRKCLQSVVNDLCSIGSRRGLEHRTRLKGRALQVFARIRTLRYCNSFAFVFYRLGIRRLKHGKCGDAG